MKKFLLTLLAAGGMLAVNAQYFQHLYGTTRNELPRSGQNTKPAGPNGPGHVMTGSSNAFGGVPVDVTLTRTDNNGNVPAGFFNNAYRIVTATGMQLSTQGTRVIQLATPTAVPPIEFVVVGDFTTMSTGGAPGVFIATFTAGGALFSAKAYFFATPATAIHLRSVRQSTSAPTDVVACGDVQYASASGVNGFIDMRINLNTLNPVWSNLLNIQCTAGMPNVDNANDIMESPYMPNGVPEAVIVGHTRTATTANPDAFFLEVDMANGLPFPGGTAQIWATPAGDDRFYSIDRANNPNPAGFGPGFIVSGSTNGYNVNFDFWTLKMNPTGNAAGFETTTDYVATGTQNNYAFDAIERLNTFGLYEYYVTGYVNNGSRGGVTDALTDKLNANLIGVAAGEFTYGGPGADTAHEVDYYDTTATGPRPGLSTFARTIGSFPVIGNEDFYLVKSYFNGRSGCNEGFITPLSKKRATPVYRCPVVKIDTLLHDTLTNPTRFPMTDRTLCFNVNIPGGSNLRLAPDADDGSSSTGLPYPNPVDAASGMVQLNYQSAVDGNVTVRLFDITGRVCSEQIVSVITGDQTLTINLGSGLSTGIYQLQITNGSVVSTTRIAVK